MSLITAKIAKYLRHSAITLLFLCWSVNYARAKPFEETKEYKTVESVWKWYTNDMIGTAPKKPLRLNYFVNREIEYYSEKRGYLWPENQQLVQESLEQFRDQLREGKEQKAGQFYYPYRGLTPLTAKEARYYYDVTANVRYQTKGQPADSVNISQFITDLQFDSYFLQYKALGTIVLNNTESPMYILIFGLQDEAPRAYEALKKLCTPTNKHSINGKQRRMNKEDTIQDIAIAFYTLGLLEANYLIALDYRNHFKDNIELPLESFTDLSSAYAQTNGNWPENRRSFVDQCRTDFESAGRLEVLIARSRQ